MKKLLSLLALVGLLSVGQAHGAAIGGQAFTKTIHLMSANLSPSPSASNDGRDYASALPFEDGDLLDIPANVVITNVYMIVDEAIAGLTAFNLGDDDDADGLVASSSPAVALAIAGSLNYYGVGYKGVYLKDSNGVVANHVQAKYYAATGKELKIDTTGTSTAGKARVFVEGYVVGKSGL